MAMSFSNILIGGPDDISGTASLFTYPFTVNFWFKTTVDNIGTINPFTLHNTTDDERFTFAMNTSPDRLLFQATDGVGTASSVAAVSYTVGAWQMATGVATSLTSRTVYLNGGNSVTNTTSKDITTPTKWYIGGSYSGGVENPSFDGEIAEVGIWNVALTAAEVASMFAGHPPSSIRPNALRVYVPLIRNIQDVCAATTSITTQGTAPTPHVRRYG